MATNATQSACTGFDYQTVAEQIGYHYVESDSLPQEQTKACYEIYRKIARTVEGFFHDIPVPVTFQAQDPYDSYSDMKRKVEYENKLRVYNQHADHPAFTCEENLKFRAVHDWYGHLDADVDFSPKGEFQKWLHMSDYFTGEENKVLFGEIVGQVGAVHYLPDGFESDKFQQRAFVAPQRWIDWMKYVAE